MIWEYKVHTLNAASVFSTGNVDPKEMSAVLNQYGRLGWELVSAFDTNKFHGGTALIVLTFKRPIDPALRAASAGDWPEVAG